MARLTENYPENITIIGGGIAGLTCAILLSSYGFEVTLIEKKRYPFHRVCGEYVSNEVLPFLKATRIEIEELQPSQITRLAVSAASGKLFETTLDLGGFGISRYKFDELLYKKAAANGVKFCFDNKVTDIFFKENCFELALSDGSTLSTSLVIAAYGKRSNLDQKISRAFFYKRSPYAGIKYHIKTDFPADLIQLDNFEGGYSGIQKIENERYCLCYLTENRLLKKFGNITALEENILYENPALKRHFTDSEFLFEKPEVINEISFEQKTLVENHILFCGDAAGMITPLCGNGMAMAMHSAKILSEIILGCPDFTNPAKRFALEQSWKGAWENQFALRLKTGRLVQRLFGNPLISEMAVGTARYLPSFANFLIKKTHGQVFK